MHCPRDNLLSRSGLAEYKDIRGARGDLLDKMPDLLDFLALPDEHVHQGAGVLAFPHLPVEGMERLAEMEELRQRVDVKGLPEIAYEVRQRLRHLGMALVLDEDKGRVRVFREKLIAFSREVPQNHRE